MSAGRKFFVGGNWKMNGDVNSITSLCTCFNNEQFDSSKVDVVIACPSVYLSTTRSILREDWGLAAQNCYLKDSGAFTGEISPSMIREFATSVILGHSERRHIFGENNDLIAEKASFSLSKGLQVIFCVGETLEERNAGQTINICIRQLEKFCGYADINWDHVVIAYEPVWAIGTGVVATPEQAQQVHADIRQHISRVRGQNISNILRIIYGGSVTPDNCRVLALQNDIDGFLVGGASLKKDFINIVNARC